MRAIGLAVCALFLTILILFPKPRVAHTQLATTPASGSPVARGSEPSAPSKESNRVSARISFASLPMTFEPNVGQSDPRVKFLSRGAGYTLFVTSDEAVLSMPSRSKNSYPYSLRVWQQSAGAKRKNPDKSKTAVVRIALIGATRAPHIEGIDRMAARSNYFIGNDPKKWRTDVPNYAKVELENVYPGIDLIYHGSAQGQLEYDFRLAPGADPNEIRLGFKGGNKLALDQLGNLVVQAGDSKLIEHAPAIYEEGGGQRRTVAGGWKLRGAHEATFKVAAYDRRRPIVIDPTLLYSTYLGGSRGDYAAGIAADSKGNVYVTGQTTSADFPTSNALYNTCPSGTTTCASVFVAKLDPAASGAESLIYSTYLGGSTALVAVGDPVPVNDFANGIAVDSAGSAYITGETNSNNFPTTASAFKVADPFGLDAFVTELDPTGGTLVYSTYFGGSPRGEQGLGIAVDSGGFVYVAGQTYSTNVSLMNAYQITNNADAHGGFTGFVAKFDPTATGAASLLYSTYLGGSTQDYVDGIAVDSGGNAYVTGYTESNDFPTTASALQTAFNGGPIRAFVAEFNPAATGAASLLYSTYLGGSSAGEIDEGHAIAVDSAGKAYVTGGTTSTDFPIKNAFQSTFDVTESVFVTKLDPTASGSAGLLYSTYLGGNGTDRGLGIAVDSAGLAYVTGWTSSLNFPIKNSYQSMDNSVINAFVAKFDPSASGAASLLYSTYVGGSGADGDIAYGIAVDSAGNADITGSTSSADFPTHNAFQNTFGGGSSNAFVTQFNQQSMPTPTATATATATSTSSKTPTATPSNGGSSTPTPTSTPTIGTPTATPTPTPVPVTLKIKPKVLKFPKTIHGTTSNPKKVKVSNPKSSKKHMGHLVLIEMISDPGVFEQTNNCPASLAAGSSCTISVTFAPSVAGKQTGTLTITDNANGRAQTVKMTGTGK